MQYPRVSVDSLKALIAQDTGLMGSDIILTGGGTEIVDNFNNHKNIFVFVRSNAVSNIKIVSFCNGTTNYSVCSASTLLQTLQSRLYDAGIVPWLPENQKLISMGLIFSGSFLLGDYILEAKFRRRRLNLGRLSIRIYRTQQRIFEDITPPIWQTDMLGALLRGRILTIRKRPKYKESDRKSSLRGLGKRLNV